MSEDFDVEAMLEAPFNKEGERKRSGSHEDKKRYLFECYKSKIFEIDANLSVNQQKEEESESKP